MLFADIVLVTLFVFILLVAITVIAHIWVRVPYLPTPQSVVERMMELAELKPGDHVYDLGAGDGRLLIAAKRHEPSVIAVGYELVPTVCLLGKLRCMISRQKVDLRFGNALKADLRDADCIFIYLMPRVMRQLEEKFAKELKPGTRILSYVFRLPGRTPEKEVEVPWLGERRSVLVYRW